MTQECEKCKRLDKQSARILNVIETVVADTVGRVDALGGPSEALRMLLHSLLNEVGADMMEDAIEAFREGRLA